MNQNFEEKKIFEPLKLNNLTLRNRLLRSATWEGIASKDGSINEKIYSIYEELSKGGIGGIITGFTSVDSNDHYFQGMMRLSDDKLIPQFKKLTDIVHNVNCPIFAQLALGALYKNSEEIYPDDMTINDIKEVINLFIQAAERAKKANYDGIQIHAAHFLFLSRFISPLVNQRSDSFDGSTENRIKILIEILKGIKEKNLNLHISLKINSSDFEDGGINEDECVKISKIMKKECIDSIEISGNGTSRSRIKPHINEAYFLKCAENVANNVKFLLL
jgi:2,4-dienoyl-CoA reductase-like NADH-dependent reductase (Old Yellow Enzyme family)